MPALHSSITRRLLAVGVIAAIIFGITKVIVSARERVDDLRAPDSETVDALAGVTAPVDTSALATLRPFAMADSLLGRSGKVRFKTLTRVGAIALPGFIPTFGEAAIRTPGVHHVAANGTTPFALVVLRPFGEKRGDVLQGYRLGKWPSERWMVGKRYYNPDGFIEVTPANVGLRLSRHFALADFLTHDQRNVWPKFVVLQEPLIDKLELVLADLAEHGVKTDRVRVLSGFRAPYYNDRIVAEGAARSSRHQYGDAADIIIDANGDGRMDDLNRDGRSDTRDADVLYRLFNDAQGSGGLGKYAPTRAHGPFVHVDLRDRRARW